MIELQKKQKENIKECSRYTKFTFKERLFLFLWIIPLTVLSFGLKATDNQFKNKCKVYFLVFLYIIVFTLITGHLLY